MSDPVLLRGPKGPDAAPENKILKFTSKFYLFHRHNPGSKSRPRICDDLQVPSNRIQIHPPFLSPPYAALRIRFVLIKPTPSHTQNLHHTPFSQVPFRNVPLFRPRII